MRIAYFSPLSPQRSGISDYSELDVLPYLRRHADIDVFVRDGFTPSEGSFAWNFNVLPHTEFLSSPGSYDAAMYHMGNNTLHEHIYDCLMKVPGFTVLHDVFLHGFLAGITLARGDGQGYVEEFRRCYGERGAEDARNTIAKGVLSHFEHPLTRRITQASLGTICQSDYALKVILSDNPGARARMISQPYTVEEPSRDIAGPQGNPQVCSLGYMSSHKRYDVILKAFGRLLAEYPKANLMLIGQDLIGVDSMVRAMGLEGSVTLTGYLPKDDALGHLANSDFCVNLRYPTAGETGRSVLQAMSCSKPTIVSDIGWFSELPGQACLKLAVDRYEEETLAEYMLALADDETLRKKIGANAREYVGREHSPSAIAIQYAQHIRGTLNGDDMMARILADAATDAGIVENDVSLMRDVSEKVSGFLGR